MKRTLTAILAILSLTANAKIVYVDHNDATISTGSNGSDIYLDIDRDGTSDLQFRIALGSVSQSCKNTNGSTVTGNPFYYYANGLNTATYGINNRILDKPDCSGDTINHFDLFSTSATNIATRVGNTMCSTKAGSYKLGFRLTKKNPANNANGFLYGYVEYTLTASGDLVVHGWHYNDAFNEPIIADSKTPYPYNGCVFQDTVKTYVKVNVYDTVKVPKTVYDTVKVTQIEIVKKTVYDTVTVEKIVHKAVCDSTVVVTVHDTVHKTIYDTITHHVTVNDTVTKTIYDTVELTVYDTVPVPVQVHDTLVANLGKNTGQRLRMWPNPASQTITLDLSSPEPASILVIDQSGQTVADFGTTSQITTLDAGQWAQGTYTVTVTQGQASTTKHVQINR